MFTPRGKALFALVLAVTVIPGLSFVNIPKLHSTRRQQQQQRPSSRLTGIRKKRRYTHCLRCAAIALAVAETSVGEEGDFAASRQNESGTAVQVGSSPSEGGGRPTLVGEEVVVLSDWLEKSREEGKLQVISDQGEQGLREISPPHRFQELIQEIWAKLSRGNQLGYLGGDGQDKVKGALTILAAYCALREHPLQAGVESPQQAFSEMDFDSDGEVSFDEFVRWYSMSSALDEPDHVALEKDGGTIPTVVTDGKTMAPSSFESAIAPASGVGTEALTLATGSRGSRLLADVEKSLALTGIALGGASTAPNQPRSAALDTEWTGDGSATSASERSAMSRQESSLLAPRTPSLPTVVAATTGSGPVATEEEKEAARERWLAGETVEPGTETRIDKANLIDDGDLAAQDLEKALEMLCLLVNANADAETLVAALASCIVRNSMGRYNLEVIEEQFGPIIRGIVEDRLLLERLPEPTSSASYLAIQQSFGVKSVLDLDDYHAKLMRDFLVHSSRDARAVVVHMADLTCRLRNPNKTPPHARHTLALEALQLYVPMSNALGLGSSFLELEELGYKTIFPQTYSNMALWHHNVKDRSHDIVREVKKHMLDALHARKDLSERVHSYRLEGRTKGLVSTFRKVFRQNKRATDVHDILGFRIIVNPKRPDKLSSQTGDSSGENKARRESEGRGSSRDPNGQDRVDDFEQASGGKGNCSKPARSLFTVKTFPPPYRDADSRLLHDVYEVLVGLFDEVPGRFKNYVDFPKKNGYRSVHTTVLHSTGLRMEFQVRTTSMHAEAEGGTASHSLYKGSLDNPEEASLFRSKMTPNILSPAHRQLPSKTKTDEGPASTVGQAEESDPVMLSQDGGKEEPRAGDEILLEVASCIESSDLSPEP